MTALNTLGSAAIALPWKTIRVAATSAVIGSAVTAFVVAWLMTTSNSARWLELTDSISQYMRVTSASTMARDAAYVLAHGNTSQVVDDGKGQRIITPAGTVELTNPWGDRHHFDINTLTWTLALPERACRGVLRSLPPEILSAVGTGADVDHVVDWSSSVPESPEAIVLRCSAAGAVALRFNGKRPG